MDRVQLLSRVAQVLQSVGYKGQLLDGGDFVLTSTAGTNVVVYVYESDIQLNSYFTDTFLAANGLNAINKATRFCKAFIADNGFLHLVVDQRVDPSSEGLADALSASLMDFERGLAVLRSVWQGAGSVYT